MFCVTKISKLIIQIILINLILVLSSEYHQSFAQEQGSESELVDINEIILADSILDNISKVAHQRTISYLEQESVASNQRHNSESIIRILGSGVRFPTGNSMPPELTSGQHRPELPGSTKHAAQTPGSRKLVDCQEYVKRLREEFKLSQQTIKSLNNRCPYDVCSKEAKAWYSFVIEEIQAKINKPGRK